MLLFNSYCIASYLIKFENTSFTRAPDLGEGGGGGAKIL